MNYITHKITLSKDKQYLFSTIILLIFIFVLYNLQNAVGYETVSLILILILFLLPVFNFEQGPIILSAVVSALAWDYYFIPPHFTMHIAKTEDGVMLLMFFVVAVTNGVLTSKLKAQKNEMELKEKRLNSLYTLVKSLSAEHNLDDLVRAAVDQIFAVFGFEAVIFFPADENQLRREAHPASSFSFDEMEWLAAEVAFKEKIESGRSTNSLPAAKAKYFPVIDEDRVVFVIGLTISDKTVSDKSESEFLNRFLSEIVSYLNKSEI